MQSEGEKKARYLATRLIYIGLGIALIPALAGSEGKDPILEIKLKEIEAIVESADNKAWVGLFTQDAVVMPPNSAPVQGKAAISALYAPAYSGYANIDVEYRLQDTQISGPLAVMRYAGTATLTRPSGESYRSHTHYLDILKQQPDGDWLISLHAWSLNRSEDND